MEKLTQEQTQRVICLYLPCKVQMVNIGYEISEAVATDISLSDNEVGVLNDGTVDCWGIENVKLILIPISQISDEHRAEVARIATSWDKAGPLPTEDVSEWLEEILNGNCAVTADYVSGYQASEIIDFLRSKSYHLPYMGIDIYEAGVAVKPTV